MASKLVFKYLKLLRNFATEKITKVIIIPIHVFSKSNDSLGYPLFKPTWNREFSNGGRLEPATTK